MGFEEDPEDETALSEPVRARIARWLGREDVRIEGMESPTATGFSSETRVFDLVVGNDERRERLVLRAAPRAFRLFPTYDLDREVRLLRSLRARGLPVANVRWLEKGSAAIGAPFFVMDHIAGRVPPDNPPLHLDGWVTELIPDERRALWWSGFDAMCDVHRIGDVGLDDLPGAGDPSPLASQLDEYDAYVDWGLDRERHPGIVDAIAFLRAQRPSEDEPRALCWGDSRLGNQIFDGTRCVALLDWEMARIGHPVQDLAWWLASDRCFSEGLETDRLGGFPSREECVARWEAHTGFSASSLVYYEVLALMRFAVQIGRVGLRMKELEILDPDDEFDRDNFASQTLARALAEARG